VGRALAQELAQQGYDLVLAARDARDLDSVTSDVGVRRPVRAHGHVLDLSRPELDADRFCTECVELLGGVDAVFLTAAQLDADDRGIPPPGTIANLVQVNLASALKILSAFARHFEAQRSGELVVFSSIAAAAPRRRNAVYSSTKAALEVYCRGLRHHLAETDVRVQVYRLGYVDTAMTFGQKLLFPVTSPDSVAACVVRNLGRDRGLVHFPRFWWAVVFLLSRLPWVVYRRLAF
jgi:NAD(P)-dependent dehydrogenase (short-subunit alcohol dehydrogenase family)